MTLTELEERVKALEAEAILLQHEILRLKGVAVIPGFGPIGTFADDPTFDEAVKYGRKYRDLVNRGEYVDPLVSDDAPTTRKKVKRQKRKKAPTRKTDART
jgi:hypothetical protein